MIGERFKSNHCGWFTVIEKIAHEKGARWKVEFDKVNEVRYTTITDKRHVLKGDIRNPYYPLKLGIACIGIANSKQYPLEFNKWRAMIERCYDHNNNHYNSYGGKGVLVCNRWLCFEYFLINLPNIQGYEKDKLHELHLDKDIIGSGKLYSPDNCVLVSPSKNIDEMHERTKYKKFKATNVKTGDIIFANNQSEFARQLGVNNSNISHCIRGKQKTILGYKIELLEEL